jgi:hypothetical protein
VFELIGYFSFDKQSPFAFGTEKRTRLEIQGRILDYAVAHYSDLRVLERYFKVKFTELEISKISDIIANEVATLSVIIQDGFYEHDFATGIYLPDELTEYKTNDAPSNFKSELNLILEKSKIYTVYGVQLPLIYPTLKVIEPVFLREGAHFGVRSVVGKIHHGFLDQSKFDDFKKLQRGNFPVDRFIK